MTNTILNRLPSPNPPITDRTVRVSPVGADITPDPAARVDLEIKLIADDTHAEVAEPVPTAANTAPALLSREDALAGDVPAPLVQENLR